MESDLASASVQPDGSRASARQTTVGKPTMPLGGLDGQDVLDFSRNDWQCFGFRHHLRRDGRRRVEGNRFTSCYRQYKVDAFK